ncbi:hypothetical protein ACLGIH_02675 [Streptomyces sp. HMX87]|uniref:hypothetical protein n=1 Tax=Streptomyces sp. HMX87 TaxID=3390849 RepID=UPI003A85AA34
MNKSSCALVAALAVAVAFPVPADAAPARESLGVAHAPADVTALECLRGGGMLIVAADGSGPGGFTKRCQGGTHDGETVV